MLKLDHENLDVYQLSLQFVSMAQAIADSFPKGRMGLADQLKRAAWSIPLNLAEGFGRTGPGDRGRSYSVSRGSAHECGAILDLANHSSLLSPSDYHKAKSLLVRIVQMIVKLMN